MNGIKSALASGFFLGPASALAEMAVNLPPPATGIAREIYSLHTLVLWICVGIFVVVFLPMFYALWRHRRSRGHAAASFSDNTKLEVVWTIIPVLILIGMAWPATQLILAMKNVGNSDLTIKVTGHQWNWDYEYLDDGLRLVSNMSTPRKEIDDGTPQSEHYLLEVDHPLVIPINQKIRLVLTATDVIHSWWVPALGVKQDAIPGFIKETWFSVDEPGIYRGQCAELCGVGHGFMPIVVEAMPPEQFDAWKTKQLANVSETRNATQAVAGKVYSLDELKARGEKVYNTNCAACHQPTGLGIPGTFPALDGSSIVNGPVSAHLDRVFNGKPNTTMPAFGKLKMLSDLDIAAVVTYERNSWHNHVAAPGNMVQPADVAALHH
ncbi:MAG: cytochrome c oxidase subunit II [Georgfuchsia sp.]